MEEAIRQQYNNLDPEEQREWDEMDRKWEADAQGMPYDGGD